MRLCQAFVVLYIAASLLALAAIPLSAAGWIEPDPLSAVPAMLLGTPWSYGFALLGGFQSVALNVALLAAAMALNAALLWALCRYLNRR